MVGPDGAVRHFQSRGTVVVDDLAQPVKLVGTGQDITERKQAEEALARYAALIESSEDALVTQSLEGRILTWNPGAEGVCGHRSEEVAGRLLAIVEPPERAGELEGLLARVQRGEHIELHETVRMRKDGARIAVSVSISPITDGEGRIIGASSIARDITERDFAGQLHSARETERTQMAREIHDELGQALTALKMDLFSLNHTVPALLRDPLLVKTDEMAKLIDEMVDKVRTLATELRPAGLDSLGRDGAAGYLSKDRSPQELIAAVRKNVQGGMYRFPAPNQPLAAALDAGRAPIPHEALSDPENEVLRLIGAGKAGREIAAVLSLSPKTVSTYRTRILEKLVLRTSAELIRYALQHQLMP